MAGRFWRFYEKANDVVRTFTGPAAVGIGRPEEPEVRPADPDCPLCGKPMSLHRIERHANQRIPTKLHCPTD
ncbi:hypothetical protein WDJ51_04460 [Rathayibacter sp. YIM 133350]|uniref:hypothetical protein n=1 Tax=Rathayibacter sp. YIM 133350 TaxID=3131992 RepID=UPI00307FB817